MNINQIQLQIPTQSFVAALSHLQSIPVKATLENQKLAQQILQLSIALKLQAPDIGRVVNLYV